MSLRVPVPDPKRLRPWYLVVAMALTWFAGIRGSLDGYSVVMFLRGGHVPDVTEVQKQAERDPDQLIPMLYVFARQRALADFREVTFPLAVGKLLLSGLLVIASGVAMTGRRGARNLALQALAANALLCVIDYALTRHVRGAWIDVITRTSATLDLMPEQKAFVTEPPFWWWVARIVLAFEIGILGVGALALVRRRTGLFFEAVSAASDRAEEEEEP